MRRKFRIGEIAGLFQLPASTLRYYDEIGIFKPKYTDDSSRYRYYTVDQFPVLDTIIFMKKNGFTMKDIQEQLKERTPENTKERLERKLDEVRMEKLRLSIVEEKIKNKISTIEQGLTLMSQPSMTYQWFPARPVSYIYNDEPIDLKEASDDIYVKDLEYHSLSGIMYDGFFTGDFGTIADMDSLDGEGPVKYRSVFELLHKDKEKPESSFLAEGMYACYPHKGKYEAIKQSYRFMLEQLKIEGCEIIGNAVEISLLDESVIRNEKDYMTWIQIPVRKND